MRRHATALHQQLGGGVLRGFNEPGRRVGKWWVNTRVLAAHHQRDEIEEEREATQSALGEHLLRIEDLERKTQALRDRQIALKKRVDRVEQLAFSFGSSEKSAPAAPDSAQK